MVKFCELLHALFHAHDNDDTAKLVAADALDDAAGGIDGDARFPARFLKFRAEWIRANVGASRRNHYGLSYPERNFLADRVDEFRAAFAPAVSSAGNWKGDRCSLVMAGRFLTARVRVAHPNRPKATLGATARLEFRRGLVYRVHVHDAAFRLLTPTVLTAFPEATVRYLPGEHVVHPWFPGVALGELPGGAYSFASYGSYITADESPHLFAEFVRIVSAMGWRDSTLVADHPDVAAIKPRNSYPKRSDETYTTYPARNAALLALDAAATAVARKAAGIEHHFAQWWDCVKHPAKLDGMNPDVVAARQSERKENWK